MLTISQQLTELVNQKNALANNLVIKGVKASTDETLNTLVPKVLDIQTGGSGENKLAQLVDKSITEVTAEDFENITEIGSYAFYRCKSLTKVSLPDSIKSIGERAFYECSKLNELALVEGITEIKQYAFSSTKLTSLIIPNSVTIVGNSITSGCSELETIVFGRGLTSIGDSMFRSCTSLNNVIIPNNITTINASAFYSCKALSDITIPDEVKTIGYGAFDGCGFVNFNIPAGITAIPNGMLQGCLNLNTIEIPDNITSIGNYAFQSCASLNNVIIGKNVSSMGSTVFNSCQSLKTLTILATTPPSLSNTNAISTATTKIYIPVGTLSAYQNATNWSNFADLFEELSE